MPVIVDLAFEAGAFPQDFAGLAVKTEYLERLFMVTRCGIGMHPGLVVADVVYSFRAGNHLAFNRGGQKDAVTPDDRRGMAASGQRSFPRDVFVGAPFGRQILLV